MPIVCSKKFDGVIWRIAIGDDACIGLEIRNEESLEVQFRRMDLFDFSMAVIEHAELDWWMSMIWLDKKEAYFKKYESEKDPFRQHILRLDHESTSLTESTALKDGYHGDFKLPAYFPEGSESWKEIADFLELPEGVTLVKGMEYIENKNFIVVAYHMSYNEQLSRNVLIMKSSGEVVYHEEIDETLSGEASESFITFANLIIFVARKNEIIFFEI